MRAFAAFVDEQEKRTRALNRVREEASTDIIGLGMITPARDLGAWREGNRKFLPTLYNASANPGPFLRERVPAGAWSDRDATSTGRVLNPPGGRDVTESGPWGPSREWPNRCRLCPALCYGEAPPAEGRAVAERHGVVFTWRERFERSTLPRRSGGRHKCRGCLRSG